MTYRLGMTDTDSTGPPQMTLRELRDHLGRRVDAAYYAHEITIITKNGEPRAALVPIDQVSKEHQ